nr:ImcF-related family protein [Pseudomonas sp. dw_358]
MTLGLVISYVSNRAQIAEIPLAVLQEQGDAAARLKALHTLASELKRLSDQQHKGAPWRQRFGLNPNVELGKKLWPLYVETHNTLLRDPARAALEGHLIALLAVTPGTPQRAAAAQTAYDPLKAYLMLAAPDKVDPAFLANALMTFVTPDESVPNPLWQTLAPDLWRFYAEQLPSHPEWAIQPDRQLIAQARQVMVGQLGQRNGEAALYLEVLEQARSHYPDLQLSQMTGDTDVAALFATKKTVPGLYTRQAWEGSVRAAIDTVAQGRREQIDWVLGDPSGHLDTAMSPEALKARLTERYFDDFSDVWLTFLNSLRWRPANSLPEVIDQLTLMSDIRQSPLIALVNTLAYQGQTGAQGQALAESLIQSAQQWVNQKTPAIDQNVLGLREPLDKTFGPLLKLVDQSPDAHNLQTFLTRVTRVRLKLQQVSNAPDPQAMTQALAQTVFQGKGIDLTDTRDYGSLIAAGLGAQWSGFGQSLFVQPLNQAWQSVLQPSAASLNRQWQRHIVDHWNSAFSGRYPFAGSGSDASLPMLGQMIRSGTGRIDQFLAGHLGGVLRKEGDQWVADSRHSQGLKFHPDFIKSMNQLSHLADVLYTDGSLGLHFELQAKAVRDVVQTTFVLNGQTMAYYNQRESWHRFPWPGRSDYPGMHLTWTSVKASNRLFGTYDGPWGFIRWLEQAQVTPLDDSDTRYQLVLTAPDGIDLTWFMRTELGRGPLTLLQLRGFRLPSQIFMTQIASTEPGAARGES